MNATIEVSRIQVQANERTMRAVVAPRYGGAEVMAQAEVAVPKIGEREVLVRVRAGGLDRGTWHLMEGKPYLLRLFGFGLLKPSQPVMGRDLSGVVVEVGAKVTRFAPGDEVFGIGEGSFAELCRASEDKLAKKPGALSFEQAAVLGISGLTALKGLETAQLRAGQKVLIIGASGGVGSYLVQLARALGAEVTAVCSGAKAEWVRSLGATHVIDYRREDYSAGTQRYDVIFDGGGHPPIAKLRKVLAPKGTVVFVGSEDAGDLTGGIFGRPLWGALVGLFTGQKFKMLMNREHFSGLEQLVGHVEAGELKPALERSVPLASAQAAMRALVAGEVRGKVAVSV